MHKKTARKGQAALEFMTTSGFVQTLPKTKRAFNSVEAPCTISHETPQHTFQNKKSQAALEFLTTYGWAFVIILTTIGALSYFGILRPPISDRCIVGPEFICQDYQLIANNYAEAQVILANSKDFNMKIYNVNCTFPNGHSNDDNSFDIYSLDGTAQRNNWEPGERRKMTCNLPNNDLGGLVKDDKAKIRFTITYQNQDIDGFNHTINGEVVATVQ